MTVDQVKRSGQVALKPERLVNVAMFLAPGEAATYSHRKRAYAFMQEMAGKEGRVLVGEPIERPCDQGIWIQSETRPE